MNPSLNDFKNKKKLIFEALKHISHLTYDSYRDGDKVLEVRLKLNYCRQNEIKSLMCFIIRKNW